MRISEDSMEWRELVDQVLEVAGGALPWPDLQERLLKRMAKLGTQAEHLALQVLANIPESYLSSEDCLVRLPRQDRACVRCEDLAALKHELRVAARSSSLVLLSFSSTLCVPCGRLKPELQQLALEMPEVIFLEVDVEQNEAAADAYQVTCLPTCVFLKEGQVLGRYEGSDVDTLTLKLVEYK
ncbi:unnamed protein product [Durusdinium trenchii]|uniref:Uncharacterized protein n=2 Tax=Durusdinium trenchii TaxID=1381693 RepID=A0ABP0S0Q7_9DINO